MLAEHSAEIMLRARVDLLEEENRQLREMIGLDQDAGFVVAARAAFAATPTQAKILQVLITGAVCRSELLMTVCGSGEPTTDNNLKVQLSKLRAKLEPHDVWIKNQWGVGYSLSPEHRSKVLELMAATVDDDELEAQ